MRNSTDRYVLIVCGVERFLVGFHTGKNGALAWMSSADVDEAVFFDDLPRAELFATFFRAASLLNVRILPPHT